MLTFSLPRKLGALIEATNLRRARRFNKLSLSLSRARARIIKLGRADEHAFSKLTAYFYGRSIFTFIFRLSTTTRASPLSPHCTMLTRARARKHDGNVTRAYVHINTLENQRLFNSLTQILSYIYIYVRVWLARNSSSRSTLHSLYTRTRVCTGEA